MSYVEIYIEDFKAILTKNSPLKNFPILNNIEYNSIQHNMPIIIENCKFK